MKFDELKEKGLIIKEYIIKNKVISIVLGISILLNMFTMTSCSSTVDELELQKEETVKAEEKYNNLYKQYKNVADKNRELKEKVEEASPYFEQKEEEERKAREEEERKAQEEAEQKAKEEEERKAQEEEERKQEQQEKINKRNGNIDKSEYKNGYYIGREEPSEGDKVYVEGQITERNVYGTYYEYVISACGTPGHQFYVYVDILEGCDGWFKTCHEEWNSKTFYGVVAGSKMYDNGVMKEKEILKIYVDYIEE